MDITSTVAQYTATHNWGNLLCAPLAIEAGARSVYSFAEGLFQSIDFYINQAPAAQARSIESYRTCGNELFNAAVFFFGATSPLGGIIVPVGMILHDRIKNNNAVALGIVPAPGSLIAQRYYVSRLATWVFTPVSHILTGVVDGVANVFGVSARTASVAVAIFVFVATVATVGAIPAMALVLL